MKKFKKMLPYLIVNVIAFYLTPFLIKDTGSGMLILLIGFPIICFIVACNVVVCTNYFYFL